MKILQSDHLGLLKKALNVYTRQHEAHAQNVANANNPNYQRMKTDFTNVLQNIQAPGSLRTSDTRHIAAVETESSNAGRDRYNQQPIDLTEEMADLAVNQIRFDFGARMLRQMYEDLSASITGRTR